MLHSHVVALSSSHHLDMDLAEVGGVDAVGEFSSCCVDIISHFSIDLADGREVSSWMSADVRILTSLCVKFRGFGSRTVEWSCINFRLNYIEPHKSQ